MPLPQRLAPMGRFTNVGGRAVDYAYILAILYAGHAQFVCALAGLSPFGLLWQCEPLVKTLNGTIGLQVLILQRLEEVAATQKVAQAEQTVRKQSFSF